MPDRVRIFFSSRPPPDAHGSFVSHTGYLDVSRDNPLQIIHVSEEPILLPGPIGTFDEFGIYPASVCVTEDEVRIYYAGWTRCESVHFNAAIGLARSSDGESFDRLGPGPVLSYSPDEPFVLGSPRARLFDGRWYLWYASGREWSRREGRPEVTYTIRMASSDDGIAWTKLGRDLLPERLGSGECQACPDVFFAGDRYHMFFSYRPRFDYKVAGRGYEIGYAHSTDLIHWSRDDSQAGLSRSPSGWDSESASYSHLFSLDGDVYMLYQGNHFGRTGFGLAKLDGTLDG
jgi:sucrose-6-phosphate hydrolase SacC (GH32 family)